MKVHWLLTWITAIAIAGSGWLGYEIYWRSKGYTPTVMDSYELWSQFRDRVIRSAPPLRIALLGASRIQYGIAPDVFRDEARNTDPSMLAINSHYPLAALRDLAKDHRFNGIAIVGIDARGMNKAVWEMQEKYIQFYHHDWSPARVLHRRLLTLIQKLALAVRPDFAFISLIKRYLDGHGAPNVDYVTFQQDRSGGTDYVRSNITIIREARVADLHRHYSKFTPAKPDAWLKEMHEVVLWVEQINARGGKVVFYREPVSDEHFEFDERYFPRSLYWDRLASIMPATMINFIDYPELNNIDTPDTSHIDIKDIDRHTRSLVKILQRKGVLPAPSSSP